MWCTRGGKEVRWGCPARGHGAVATQTRGCSQCLYQRLPKSYGNIRVNAAGRAVAIRRRRVSRSRRCSYAEKPENYGDRPRAACISPRVRKGGTGNGFGGRLLAGLPPRRRSGIRSGENSEERSAKGRKRGRREISRERARRAEEGEGAKEQERTPKSPFYPKIATPRRASRHCRLARSTWGRKVRESTRMERARRDRKREREKGRETGSLRGCEKDGGSVPTRLTTTRKERRRAPL